MKCNNFKMAFDTRKALAFSGKCNSNDLMVVFEVYSTISPHLRPHGEMDITRVFGTCFSGSNPDGATTF